MKYPHIKAAKLSHKQIAKAFGYKNVNSFRGSSAHKRHMQGVENILIIIEQLEIKKERRAEQGFRQAAANMMFKRLDEQLLKPICKMTIKQLEIVKKLDLKETNKSFGITPAEGVRVFEYTSGIDIAFCDEKGKRKRDTCILIKNSHKIATISVLFLNEMSVADIKESINDIIKEH